MGWLASILTSGPARKALGLLLVALTIALFLLNLRRAGEESGDPASHRWPRFQSSIRAWMATAMPIRATAMNTQRRVSR